MNVFILSPGRTATTTMAHAFSKVSGYTSLHESRTTRLGDDRVDYPENHIECDNRLVWFLPRLSEKYSRESVLVKVCRDKESIAKSYNHRWHKINMMKAYSQGIMLRRLSQNNIDVCRDYVENVYEHIEYYKDEWRYFVEIDLDSPEEGVQELLSILRKEDESERVVDVLKTKSLNHNSSGLKQRASVAYFNVKVLFKDLML